MPEKRCRNSLGVSLVEKDSIAVAFVREALESLTRQGHDPAPVLRAAAIPMQALQSDEARISAEAFGRLWLGIAAVLDDEFFGMDSRRLKVGSFATLCHLTLHARDLREALIRGARLFNLLLDDTRVELALEAPLARIRFVPGRPGAAVRIFAHETLFVMLHGLMCWLIGRRITIRRARFAYPRPPWSREYQSIYSSEVLFEAPVTDFEFDAVELESPVIQSERSAGEFLRQAPGNFILKYKNPKSLAARIRRELRNTAAERWPDFEDFARGLGLSASTLRRRLDLEGTSFRALKEGLRRDLAIRYLTQTRRPVADVAQALGFAEPSAFHRAFRQWMGVSPGDYRDALGRRRERGGDEKSLP